jgi:hypothetical protein
MKSLLNNKEKNKYLNNKQHTISSLDNKILTDKIKKIKLQINYFIKNKKIQLLDYYLFKLSELYKSKNKNENYTKNNLKKYNPKKQFLSYVNSKLKKIKNSNYVNNIIYLVFYKHKLNFYLENNEDLKDIDLQNILKNINEVFVVVYNYIFNLLKEELIILNDIDSYEFIFNLENKFEFKDDKNNNLGDNLFYQKLLSRSNLNLVKLSKILDGIILIYKIYKAIIDENNLKYHSDLYFKTFLEVNIQNIENIKLFLFNLGFLKEYLLLSDANLLNKFSLLNSNLLDNVSNIKSSYKNFYKDIIKILITIIDEIIK